MPTEATMFAEVCGMGFLSGLCSRGFKVTALWGIQIEEWADEYDLSKF